MNCDREFEIKINNDKDISNQLKILIVIRIFEYGLYNYDILTDKEKKIINCINDNHSFMNGLNIYNSNYHTILNLYCSIVLDTFDTSVLYECEKRIIEDSRLNIITNILPSAILDYRFLLGYKFESENIISVKIGKKYLNL